MDNRKTYIYDSSAKKLATLNYSLEEFKVDPIVYFPEWNQTMTATHIDYRYPKFENNGVLREKTRVELIQEGIEKLNDGELIRNGDIISIPKPEGLKIEWIEEAWIETATEDEIAEDSFKKAIKFYNSELEFASKATAELACEIISPEMFEEVKDYMRAIDPYAQTMRTFLPQRPPVFDRYN